MSLAALLAIVAGGLAVAGPRTMPAQTPVPGPGDSVTLGLADVQRLAVRQNPAFLAARQDTAIARGELRQARVYQFNPDLALQVPGVGLGGGRNPAELSLTQEIEVAGQRGLRIGAAQFGLARAAAGVRNTARLTLADASVAFYRALAADRRLAVAQGLLALNERLLAAVRTQLREGEVSTLDANLAEIEGGRARGRVLAARREATSATLELQRLVGLPPRVAVRLVDPAAPPVTLAAGTLPVAPGVPEGEAPELGTNDSAPVALDPDSLIAVALTRRGDLAAGSAAIREFETLRSLARRQNVPNLRLGAFMERAQGGGTGTTIGPAVGLSLPLFNRNQGVAAQREAQAQQARLARQATELRVRAEVTEAVRAYQTATDETRVFEETVLRPARQNTTLLETAYREGKITLPSLLLLRNQLLDAELGFWDAWLARREALVRLSTATGAIGAGETP